MTNSVSLAFVDGDAIFLDLRADRYVGLNRALSSALLRLFTDAGGDEGDEALVASLVERGLLPAARSGWKSVLCAAPALPSVSWIDRNPTRNFGSTVRSALRISIAERRLRSAPIGAVIEQFRAQKAVAPARQPDVAVVDGILGSYYWSGLLLQAEGRCLPRSIAMALELLRAGFSCDLVIGVMQRPFKAHCWVQAGDVVLNGGLDEIRPFTPILVV